MKEPTFWTEGYFEYIRDGKTIRHNYHEIKKPETTLKGKVGKWCPFGFVLKPGQKITSNTGLIDNDDEIDKKQRRNRKNKEE